ncbi:potassium-transporting ATPase subunit KdpA, partial [bacterium]|nr:potassium-transporting ATPase subunit KdpA [bacterium]
VMRFGSVVESGTAQEVLRAPQHPYTRALIDAIPHGRARNSGSFTSAPLLDVRELCKSYRAAGVLLRRGREVHAARHLNFTLSRGETLGIFWVDVTRVTLYVLLPVSLVFSLVLVALGVPQSLASGVEVTTVEGAKQTLALFPVASQEIIKQFGANGGGVFNANSAHPFENPNAWTNLIQIVAMN